MRSLSRVSARLMAVVLALVATLVFAEPVGAHTDFDYSLPADGASVGEPVSEVTVAFTLPVTLVGNGFEVLDPQENLLQPFAVTDDDAVFRLQFDPPLAGGAVGVKYTVTAEDGHVLSGAFSFTVSVDLPPETTNPPATTAPPTVAPTTVASATEATAAPATEAGTIVETVPVEPAADEAAAGEAVAAGAAADDSAADEAAVEGAAAELGEAVGDGDDSSNTSLVIAIAVAVLAAAFLVFRSRRSTTT